MSNPWLNPGIKWVDADEKARKEAAQRKAAADALSKQSYDPPKPNSGGGLFGGIKSALGSARDAATSVVDRLPEIDSPVNLPADLANLRDVASDVLHRRNPISDISGLAIRPFESAFSPVTNIQHRAIDPAFSVLSGEMASDGQAPNFGDVGSSLKTAVSQNPLTTYREAQRGRESRLANAGPATRGILSAGTNPMTYAFGPGGAALGLAGGVGQEELNARQDAIPGWRNVDPETQALLSQLGTMAVQHVGSKPSMKIASGIGRALKQPLDAGQVVGAGIQGPGFSSRRLNEMIDELGRFPTKAEVEAEVAKVNLSSDTDPRGTPAWDEYRNAADLSENYDKLKTLHDAQSPDLRGAADIDAEIERLAQEQLNLGTRRGSPEWDQLESQMVELENSKGSLRSVDTAGEQSRVKQSQAGSTFPTLNDEKLADNIRRRTDEAQRQADAGWNDKDHPNYARHLKDREQLRQMNEAAQTRGIDITQSTPTSRSIASDDSMGNSYTPGTSLIDQLRTDASIEELQASIKQAEELAADNNLNDIGMRELEADKAELARRAKPAPVASENLSSAERDLVRWMRENPGRPLSEYKPAVAAPETVAPEVPAGPPDLRTLPNEELVTIARDRSNPQSADAKLEMTRRFQAMATRKPNAPRQEIRIADLPTAETQDILDALANNSPGEHFRRAAQNELRSRDLDFNPSGRVRATGIELDPEPEFVSSLGANEPATPKPSWMDKSGSMPELSDADLQHNIRSFTEEVWRMEDEGWNKPNQGSRYEDYVETRNDLRGYNDALEIRQGDQPSNRTISGGSNPERLVEAQPITPGLTTGERVGNVARTLTRALPGREAILNNPITTPIVREGRRIQTVLTNQSGRLGRQMKLAESVFDADKDGLVHSINGVALPKPVTVGEIALDPLRSKYNLTKTQNDTVIEPLARTLQSVEATRTQFGLGDEHALTDTYGRPSGKITTAQSATEYMSNLADKSARSVVKSEAAKLKDPFHPDVEVPPEVQSVIDQYLTRNIGSGREAGRIFAGVNNALRSVWARADLSRWAIQDLPMAVDNPRLMAKQMYHTTKVMQDPNFVAKTMNEIDARNYGTGKPTTTEMARGGLQLNGGNPAEYETSGLSITDKIPVVGRLLKASERAFTDGGDLNRISQFEQIWDNMELGIKPGQGLNGLHGWKNLSREERISRIARAVNRSSGTAETPFGGDVGRNFLFAPRFLQSQLEMITKATSDWGEGSIEGQIARRQLTKMIGLGIGTTVAINAARGNETEFDPTNSNFLRIRNVGGRDVSLFGPWDSLVRGIVKAAPTYDQDGDFNFGDPLYLPRTKLSPILSTAADLLTGSDVVGKEVRKPWEAPGDTLKSLTVPFSFRDSLDADREGVRLKGGPGNLATSLVGLKSSPLTERENLDNTLQAAGIVKSDPDYLIKRREYLSAHPQGIPDELQGSYRRTREISADISARRKQNGERLTSGEQSLADFRDTRAKLLAEQRNKLSEVSKFSSNPHTPQEKWLASYFKLFDKARDPVSGETDNKLIDPLIADWERTNGSEAMDFINRYTGTGLTGAEKAYHDDLQTLQRDGYFDLPKLQKMRSSLPESRILDYRDQVSQERLKDPALGKLDFAVAARRVLGKELSPIQLMDVINSGKDAYKNPKLVAYQNTHRKELLWFNPRATWDTYQNIKPKTSKGTISGASLKSALSR